MLKTLYNMARKKTISISRKPSSLAAAANGFGSALPADPSALAVNLEPPAADAIAATEAQPASPGWLYGPVGLMVYGSAYWYSYQVMLGASLMDLCLPCGGLVRRGFADGMNAAHGLFAAKPMRAIPEHEKTSTRI